MDALKIKTLEEDNAFLRGQVQLLLARNAQLEARISELSVSPAFFFWKGGKALFYKLASLSYVASSFLTARSALGPIQGL